MGGRWGHGVHAGGGGGAVGWWGGGAREGDGGAVSSAAERHRAADRAEERPGLAKVGRGARGAQGVGGAAVSGGARTPLGGDESRRASSTGAKPGGGGGERHAVPSRPNRTGTGPAGGIPGGRVGLGTGAPGPGSLVVAGRRGGDRAGGGGLAVVVCSLPRGGGSPVGAPSGLAVKTRWRPLGSWAPSRKNLGFAGGDSAIMVWYGMVWYGMVWYGMVWYGMIWYGMVWYVVVVVVVVVAPSTCRREKLPDTLSMSRAQGSNWPASRWPGVCRRRPRGGGPCRGGGCAREEEGGATCVCYLGALPRCGGEGDPTCERRRRDGGLPGGTTRSGTCGAPIPPASGRRYPTTGEGAFCPRAPEPHERGRGGALPVSCGACTAQPVRPWRAGVPGGACTAQLVRPSRAGVPVGSAQHTWCGLGVRGFLWGMRNTAGTASACGARKGAARRSTLHPRRCGSPVRGAGCGREGAVRA